MTTRVAASYDGHDLGPTRRVRLHAPLGLGDKMPYRLAQYGRRTMSSALHE